MKPGTMMKEGLRRTGVMEEETSFYLQLGVFTVSVSGPVLCAAEQRKWTPTLAASFSFIPQAAS